MGDGLVALLGLTEKLSDPNTIAILEKFAELPSKIDLTNTKPIGPFGLVSAGFNDEIGQGLGVIIELTKAMGKINIDNGKDS